MRCFVMFVTAVCILFLFKLKWPKNKSFNYILFATLVPELPIHLQKTCASSSHFEFAFFFFQGDSLITVCKYHSGMEAIWVRGVSDRLTPYLHVVTPRPISLLIIWLAS